MEQSASGTERSNDQEMQNEETGNNNDLSGTNEKLDPKLNIERNGNATVIEGTIGDVVPTEREDASVYASTSKVNSKISKELLKGRQILIRKCKTKAKDLLAKLAKGFIPIAVELAPKFRRRKRTRQPSFISGKRKIQSEIALRKNCYRSSRRCSRCDCRPRRKY